jgi:hypothetical protein
VSEIQLPNCARPRCGHPADWHRLDDSTGVAPTDPGAAFRCIGYDCTTDGPPRECAAACPDYVELAPEVATRLADALKAGNPIICYARCWPCQFGSHDTSPHTWMDDEDREHAGHPAPITADERDAFAAKHPCGCHCNEGNRRTA